MNDKVNKQLKYEPEKPPKQTADISVKIVTKQLKYEPKN